MAVFPACVTSAKKTREQQFRKSNLEATQPPSARGWATEANNLVGVWDASVYHGGKSMAKSEVGRAKADDMRQQCERLWKFVSAQTWPLCQQDCVSEEIPASVSLWGWEPETGRDGIATMAEFLLCVGNPYDFPYVNAKLGERERAEIKNMKKTHFMLKLLY